MRLQAELQHATMHMFQAEPQMQQQMSRVKNLRQQKRTMNVEKENSEII